MTTRVVAECCGGGPLDGERLSAPSDAPSVVAVPCTRDGRLLLRRQGWREPRGWIVGCYRLVSDGLDPQVAAGASAMRLRYDLHGTTCGGDQATTAAASGLPPAGPSATARTIA